MAYAEVVLGKSVDWRTIRKSPHVTLPTEMEIPRAPLSSNPFGGLPTAKNMKKGPSNEDYVWSNSSGDDEDNMQAGPEESNIVHPQEEVCEQNVPGLAVLEEEEKFGGGALYLEPMIEAQPYPLASRSPDSLMYLEDISCNEAEDVEPKSAILVNEREGLKNRLEELLVEFDKKCQACEELKEDIAAQDPRSVEVRNVLQELERTQIRIGNQHAQIDKLEDFFVQFSMEQGGSSSTTSQSSGTLKCISKAAEP